MWEVKKKFTISVHGTWNPAILWQQGAWNYGRSSVDWIYLIAPLKQYLAENISLQSANCNILGLTATVAFFANKARFTQI